ncbi:hypothetical protein LCGC14_2624070 [marine sediment metagenome]|uniref:Uncharacterized protein n=1 Tax=marine sediment metagenome TaxID=412755 RepID=A0A0F9CD77_9ZZZZ
MRRVRIFLRRLLQRPTGVRAVYFYCTCPFHDGLEVDYELRYD